MYKGISRRLPLSVSGLVAAGLLVGAAPVAAKQPPANVGSGLRELLAPTAKKNGFRIATSDLAIRDRAGRVLVDVYARDGASLAAVRDRSESAGLKVTASDGGTRALEGFVALRDVAGLAAARGVGSVSAALRPVLHSGSAQTQGVVAERIDQLPKNIDGRGITVGALSDSFDTATEDLFGNPLKIHAADDVASGDLPGPGNPLNRTPVKVLEDDTGAGTTDEGRAMLQIVHDVAPRSNLCFATADTGEVGFANNIRRLADPKGGCGANVVVDDVGYFAEPMFSDGVIAEAIDDVAAKGVHYFSSAGNGSDQQAYQSPLRIVAPDRATAGTNIKLRGVDPALYSGGFQDFDPSAGQDIAQNISPMGLAAISLQWDDPFDPNGPPLGDPLVSATGELTAGETEDTYTFAGTAGQTVRAFVDGIPSGSTDVIIELRDPSGRTIAGPVDTGTSPESLAAKLPVDGTYTLAVLPFEGATGGYTVDVRPVLGNSKTTTDLNALLFDDKGNYLGSFADINPLSGKPLELAIFQYSGPMQLVIAKAGSGGDATQLRYTMNFDVQYDEYNEPLAPAIQGHPMARGATAVAAYDPFRPFLPEEFTSVGGRLPVYWDSQGNRLPAGDVIRQVPEVAATNGGNTTFFVSDSPADADTQPNFFGTSAAAPHAAAIGALVLQARGGPASLTPSGLRSVLQGSAFPHDLDQQHAEATGGGLTITADGDQGNENATTAGAMDDPRFFTVSWNGPGSITRLTLDGATADPSGLPGPGATSAGIVFDTRRFAGEPLFGGPGLFDQGFPFTVGAATGGLRSTDVTASFAGTGAGSATTGQYQRMTLAFRAGAMTAGRSVSFGIDRDEAKTFYPEAREGNGADVLGGIALFPERAVVQRGLGYTAELSNGTVIRGELANRIGSGWTPVDGYGFIDAQRAVTGG